MKDPQSVEEKNTGKDWCLVLGFSLLVIFLSLLPPLFALFFAKSNNLFWKGAPEFSYEDFPVYLYYIQQAAAGRWFFVDYFTTEPLQPFLSPFWLLSGRLSRFFQMSPIVVFYAARTILIPILTAVAYSFISDLVKLKWRFLALVLFFFGAGFGFFTMVFSDVSKSEFWPIDLWMPQTFVVSSIFYSPHFVASWILFLLTMKFLFKALRQGQYKYALWAGLSALALFSFHPYNAVSIYFVSFFWLVYLLFYRRSGFWRPIRIFGLFFLSSVPAVMYWFFVTHRDDLALAWSGNNDCPMPGLIYVVLGFGWFALFSFFGWRRWRSQVGEREVADFLLIWLLAQLLISFGPFGFQRQITEGLLFPLVILSMPIFFYLFTVWPKKENGGFKTFRFLLMILMAVSLSFGVLINLLHPIKVYSSDKELFFFTREQKAALDWVKEKTPETAVFLASSFYDSQHLAGWSFRQVRSGHWSETINLKEKIFQEKDFFKTYDAGRRLIFVCQEKIDYVWCGEDFALKGFCTDDYGFEKVYDEGGIRIYQIIGCLVDETGQL